MMIKSQISMNVFSYWGRAFLLQNLSKSQVWNEMETLKEQIHVNIGTSATTWPSAASAAMVTHTSYWYGGNLKWRRFLRGVHVLILHNANRVTHRGSSVWHSAESNVAPEAPSLRLSEGRGFMFHARSACSGALPSWVGAAARPSVRQIIPL